MMSVICLCSYNMSIKITSRSRKELWKFFTYLSAFLLLYQMSLNTSLRVSSRKMSSKKNNKQCENYDDYYKRYNDYYNSGTSIPIAVSYQGCVSTSL